MQEDEEHRNCVFFKNVRFCRMKPLLLFCCWVNNSAEVGVPCWLQSSDVFNGSRSTVITYLCCFM